LIALSRLPQAGRARADFDAVRRLLPTPRDARQPGDIAALGALDEVRDNLVIIETRVTSLQTLGRVRPGDHDRLVPDHLAATLQPDALQLVERYAIGIGPSRGVLGRETPDAQPALR